MVFIIDKNFAEMWEKHCDVLTGVLADSFIKFETYIKEEIELTGFNIQANCNCVDLSNYLGKCSSEFSEFNHIVTFEFRGIRKEELALNVRIKFNYEE